MRQATVTCFRFIREKRFFLEQGFGLQEKIVPIVYLLLFSSYVLLQYIGGSCFKKTHSKKGDHTLI